ELLQNYNSDTKTKIKLICRKSHWIYLFGNAYRLDIKSHFKKKNQKIMSELIANIYELWGFNYLDAFSDLMFENNIYSVVVFYTIPMVLVLTFLYYYVFDRPKTSKLWVWLVTLFIIGLGGF